MRAFWVVTTMEFRLFLRSKVTWLLGALMAVSGWFLVGGGARWNAYSVWGTLGAGYMLLTLVLAFSTGNQLQRDRDRRVDGIVLSTPVTTSTYVCAKYVAGLLLLVGFAALNLISCVVFDAVLPGQNYPALGPWPYVASWCVLVLTPLIFGAALSLLTISFTRGQRIATSMALVLVWFVPFYAASGNGQANIINVTAMPPQEADGALKLGMTFGGPAAPSPALAQQVVHLVQADVPWAHLTTAFWINRALFLALAILCLLGTISSLSRQRQGF